MQKYTKNTQQINQMKEKAVFFDLIYLLWVVGVSVCECVYERVCEL